MRDSDDSIDLFYDDPPSADEDVARLRLELRHLSLHELEDRGIVQWDREEHIVRRGPSFDEKQSDVDTV